MNTAWHTVISPVHHDSLETEENEFRQQGTLVSLSREPPQNSTDNPLFSDKSVKMDYSFHKVTLSDEIRNRYFPNNPWIGHITSEDNQDLMSYGEDLIGQLSDEFEICVIEDYNTTGLVGEVQQRHPITENNSAGKKVHTKASNDNTHFWFLRSRGAKRETKGRGGSQALGKLAFPLSSKCRTFFVVTTRKDGTRYLSGQSILNVHERHKEWFEGSVYFGDNELEVPHNGHSWKPISDREIIDDFCTQFNVNRPITEPGTSIVVIMPVDELSPIKIGYSILTNYFVPILNNILEVNITPSGGNKTSFTAENVRGYLRKDHLNWDDIPKKINQKPNPAWSTLGRLRELEKLVDTIQATEEEVFEFTLGTPPVSITKSPISDDSWSSVIPAKDSETLESMKNAYNEGKYIRLRGEVPLKHKSGDIEYGNYEIAFHKTDEPDDAEAHYYRDNISLPLVNKKDPHLASVSSLLIVRGGVENPLAVMLRDAEGPSHLDWNINHKINKNYHHGPTTIAFLKKIIEKVVNAMISVTEEKEDIWTSIFSSGNKISIEEIVRWFDIVELEEGGAGIRPLEEEGEQVDLTGKEFVARVGYPKPFKLAASKPPDIRAINVHNMTWNCTGAEVMYDVEANNGEICYDRVRIRINEPDFEVELCDVDMDLKAQIILTEVFE